MYELSLSIKKDLRNRLSRIEGQARGVQSMLDEGRDCRDVVHQLLAIRSAAHQATVLLVRDHAMECLRRPEGFSSSEDTIEGFIRALSQIPY